jgi:putative PEP-CTERM system TPR-repeat lipoprotein
MNRPQHRSSSAKRTLLQRIAAKKRLLVPVALIVLAGIGGGAYYFVHGKVSPEQRIANARKLEQAGDRKGAAIELKNALQAMPGNAEGRYLLARIHYANNDFANAEKELRQAMSKGLTTPEAEVLLARILLVLRQPQKLIDGINVRPGVHADINASILALRAQAYAMLGDKSNTELSLRQADDMVPDHPDTLAVRAGQAYSSHQYEEALAWLDKALTKEGKRADLVVMKADLLRAMKRDQESINAYHQALTLDPANVPARLAVAQHYIAAGDMDKAQAELKTLRSYSPNNLMAAYLDGLIEFRRNHLDNSINKLQEVLRYAPDFAPANLLAGAISLSQGKKEQAISHLNKVLEVSPNHPLAKKLLATAMLSNGQTQRADELISGLKNNDKDVQLLELQGNIALRSGKYQEAREKLEKASSLAPDNLKLTRELAASRMATGDEAGAIEELNKLAELDTASNQADVLLVMTHIRSKHYDEALKSIAEFERRHPGKPLADNLRGIVYLAKNDQVQARQHFTKALTVDPAYLPAATNLARLDIANKDLKSARSRFEEVLKHDPKNAKAMTAMAEIVGMEKNEAEYLKYLGQAKQADPKNAKARQMLVNYWLNKRDAGKALVEARSAYDSTGIPEFLNHIGAAQLLQGETANALSTYGKWCEASPNNPMAYYRLALVQILNTEKPDAIKTLDKALALRPNYSEAMAAKAILLGQLGKADDGIKLARAIQSNQPKALGGFLTEGEIQFGAKKYLEAATLFVKASQIANNGQPLVRAYQAYAAAGKAGDGQKILEQWLKQHPDEAALRHVLAQSLLSEKRYPESISQYRYLVQKKPDDLIALNNLAWMLGETKNPDAVGIAEMAYKVAPRNPAVLDTYGWQLAQAGKARQGIPYLRDSLKQIPDNAEIRWHLAMALDQSGESGEAAVELDRLLASQIDFPQKEQARTRLKMLRTSTR